MLQPVHHPTSFVEVRGHRLEHVDIPPQNPDRPEILLLHEGLGSVSLWRDFPQRLAARTGGRVVAYSRAGFGRSSPRDRPFGPRFMHEEAHEMLPALRAALALRSPILLGHSTGASMALIHAGEANVDRVIAIAPFAFVEASNVAAIRAARARYPELKPRLARHHDDVDGVFFGWNDLWLDPAFASWNIDAELAAVRCPVLALLGEHDEYSTPAQLERIAAKATQAQLETKILPHCGHAPHRDQPETVLDAIARFVES